MGKISPTVRSLKLMREQGYTCEVVERFNHHTMTRKDLFGFGDILCVKAACPPLILQVTASGWANRWAKVIATPEALICLKAGMRIQVHGWRGLAKYNKNGKRSLVDRWEAKIIEIEQHDFIQGTYDTPF
jgi:hypothetical protein